MKKKYVSPVIEIESFQLDAAIAANCDVKLNHYASSCEFMGSGYFTGDTNICYFDIESEGGIYDGICYHGPIDEKQFLAS